MTWRTTGLGLFLIEAGHRRFEGKRIAISEVSSHRGLALLRDPSERERIDRLGSLLEQADDGYLDGGIRRDVRQDRRDDPVIGVRRIAVAVDSYERERRRGAVGSGVEERLAGVDMPVASNAMVEAHMSTHPGKWVAIDKFLYRTTKQHITVSSAKAKNMTPAQAQAQAELAAARVARAEAALGDISVQSVPSMNPQVSIIARSGGGAQIWGAGTFLTPTRVRGYPPTSPASRCPWTTTA
ncbi:MAG: hypothetical protein ABIR11_10875 [Candidatus Limnocylindrales bacterium]